MCFLFVDRILTLTPGESIRGVKHVTWDDTYLNYDQRGQAYFASSLIGETLGQLAAWNVMAYHDFKLRPVAGIVAQACLLKEVLPGDTLLLESIIDELDDAAVRYHSVAKVGQEPVFIVDGAIGPLLPMTDFIDSELVCHQFNQINRPSRDVWDSGVGSVLDNHFVSPNRLKNTVHPSFLFDSISKVEPNAHWIAKKLVSRTAAYFPDHFPNNPVLPMTVLLECKINLASTFVSEWLEKTGYDSDFKVLELRKVKMNEFVHPGEVVESHLKLKQQDNGQLILGYQSFVEGKRVCVVDMVVEINT